MPPSQQPRRTPKASLPEAQAEAIVSNSNTSKMQREDQVPGGSFSWDTLRSGSVPSCQEGELVELWVANVGPQGYTFTMEEPRSKKK